MSEQHHIFGVDPRAGKGQLAQMQDRAVIALSCPLPVTTVSRLRKKTEVIWDEYQNRQTENWNCLTHCKPKKIAKASCDRIILARP